MIGWAILGTGFISNTVANAIKQSDGSFLATVAGRQQASVEAFAQVHDIPKTYTDFEAAIADDSVDAVYIGLPNNIHLPMVKLAAAKGKAILSEKSLTTTYADAVELIETVKSHNVFFVEGLMYLSHPLFTQVAKLVTDERLGTIRSITGAYAANIKDVVNPKGCGTLYNLGCYPASLLHFVIQQAFGATTFADYQISAVGNLNSDGNICDTAASIRFNNGVLASLQSTDSYGHHNSFEIIGDLGTLRFCTNPWHPLAGDNVLELQVHDQASETIVIPDAHDSFYYQIKAVEDRLKNSEVQARRPAPRWQDSLEIMHLLTQWEQAARRS